MTGIFIVLLSISTTHYIHIKTMAYDRGELSFSEYWSHKPYEWFRYYGGIRHSNGSDNWHDFKHKERCNNGLELNNITPDEYDELYKKYKESIKSINP